MELNSMDDFNHQKESSAQSDPYEHVTEYLPPAAADAGLEVPYEVESTVPSEGEALGQESEVARQAQELVALAEGFLTNGNTMTYQMNFAHRGDDGPPPSTVRLALARSSNSDSEQPSRRLAVMAHVDDSAKYDFLGVARLDTTGSQVDGVEFVSEKKSGEVAAIPYSFPVTDRDGLNGDPDLDAWGVRSNVQNPGVLANAPALELGPALASLINDLSDPRIGPDIVSAAMNAPTGDVGRDLVTYQRVDPWDQDPQTRQAAIALIQRTAPGFVKLFTQLKKGVGPAAAAREHTSGKRPNEGK